MKLYQKTQIIITCCVLVIFTSCIKYHKLLKNEFPQGDKQQDRREVAYNFLKTSKIYEEFNTQAIFYTLWLSDEVRTVYIHDYSERRGKDAAVCEALVKRQLEENKHWISFYLQADIRDRQHVALNDKNSLWTLYLQTAQGKRVEPISIKIVELEPEYQRYFGHRYNPFKDTYLVRFPAQDLEGTVYMQADKVCMLFISSPSKKVAISWDKKDSKKHAELLKDEDFYWC